MAALERLETLRQSSGHRFSLLAAVSEFSEAVNKLRGRALGEAVNGYLSTVAVVQRKDIQKAVAEFIKSRKHLGVAKRASGQNVPDVSLNVAMWLNEFANTFPGHAVCDLTKQHLDTYIGKFKELSAKSRNDRRATIKMFLRWCVAKDYLSQTHRLFEAVDFKAESADATDIDFYRSKELRNMLDSADAESAPVIALAGWLD